MTAAQRHRRAVERMEHASGQLQVAAVELGRVAHEPQLWKFRDASIELHAVARRYANALRAVRRS